MSAEPAKRLALVTGANKGIGFEIARKLGGLGNVKCIMAARDPERGRKAFETLKGEGLDVELEQLDISQPESVRRVADAVRERGGLDILVNNAGIAFKGDAFGADEAQQTLHVNFFGTLEMCEAFLPLMKENGRIVNVCSRAGRLSQVSEALQRQFTAEDLTVDRLRELCAKFVADIRAGRHREEGWSNSMYGVSKLAEIALTKLLARKVGRKLGILINAACPGYCKTDMSSQRGTQSAADGADTPVWLATLPSTDDAPNGGFFGERRELEW